MRARTRIWGAASVLLAVTTASSGARADDAVAAQALFDQGKNALATRNYAEACPKFEESLRLQPALGTLLNLADCYEREGKLATAWSRFLELAAKAGAAGQSERAKIGKKRAAALAPRLLNLVVVVAEATPGMEVKRDGTIAGQAEWGTPIPVDPGPHTVEATAPGKLPWSTSLSITEGSKTSTVTVPQLVPAPVTTKVPAVAPNAGAATAPPMLASGASRASGPAESSQGIGAQKVLALVSAGIGLAGIGVGSYFGLQSISNHNEAYLKCPGKSCDPTPAGSAGLDLWNKARSAGDLSTIAFVVGGAGLAGAAALWFTAPKTEGSPGPVARLGLGLGSVQLSTTW